MNFKKTISLAALFTVLGAGLFAQTYPRGAILDEQSYERVPQKAVQVSRSYTAIPKAYSLKQYAPYPGNQGVFGTCVGWSSAYAARTIAESIALNRLDRLLSTANVFSPVFLYRSVHFLYKNNPNPTGEEGANISWALDFMKKEGVVKMPDFEKNADFRGKTTFSQLKLALFGNSRRYPIGDYVRLYQSGRGSTGDGERTRMVKKSLAEGKPVIIGMNCPDSFFSAKGAWQPQENPRYNYGGHAMCVVGYDDEKYGGAFEIQNSWGTEWGNGGYIWIPYTVFEQFVSEAYEMIENLSAYKDVAEYSGFAKIEVYRSPDGMPVRFADGYYQTLYGYQSGTRFRYLLGNDKPAYVYAFAADTGSSDTTRIFPPENANVSPALDYAENTVAFPGEFSWIQLDARPGTDYLVVLYAKEPLDIDAIRRRFTGARGGFPDRVAQAVGAHYIPANRAQYAPSELRFSAKSADPKAVFGLLLAIDHR
jgi:hypothetical protein